MAFTVKRFKDYIYNELNRESRVRHMNDRAIQFEDAEGRKIKISPDEGVQVEDSAGTIIHDTPDCIIATGMGYGGHLYFGDQLGGVGTILQTYTGVDDDFTTNSTVTISDISTSIPGDITNAKAALVFSLTEIYIGPIKIGPKAKLIMRGWYSNAYNTTGTAQLFYFGRSAAAATGTTAEILDYGSMQSCVPITYNGTTPYITWQQSMTLDKATTGNGTVYGRTYLYIQGFLV